MDGILLICVEVCIDVEELHNHSQYEASMGFPPWQLKNLPEWQFAHNFAQPLLCCWITTVRSSATTFPRAPTGLLGTLNTKSE
jgi:hypothetical protein